MSGRLGLLCNLLSNLAFSHFGPVGQRFPTICRVFLLDSVRKGGRVPDEVPPHLKGLLAGSSGRLGFCGFFPGFQGKQSQ